MAQAGQRSAYARAVAAAVFSIYLVISLAYLDRFPLVGQDEPWIAAPAYKLATDGVLGLDLFTGYRGMERHNFGLPLYPVLEAGIFRLFGAGVVQMRILSVVFGLALLIAVYAVGREVGGERVGALATVIMVAERLATPTEGRSIGILLLDAARINRYDVAVPVFGLAALWVMVRLKRDTTYDDVNHRGRYVLAGALAGLSGLSHLYGLFWIPALVAILLIRDGLQWSAVRSIVLLLAGAALAWLPWIVWIGSNWNDYVAQMRTVAGRFDVFAPAFYFENIVSGEGPISVRWLERTVFTLPVDRVGGWTLTFGVPVAAYFLVSLRRTRTPGETALLVASGIQLLLFVVLLQVKSVNYVIAIWPLGALTLAWLGLRLWDRRGPIVRLGLVVLVAAILIEGGVRLRTAAEQARRTTSYLAYEEQIARCIPSGSLVLGFQHYWLGLRQFAFRSWLLAFNLANPALEANPIPLDAAIDRIDPDIILIDRHARELFAETTDPSHPYHHLSVGWEAFRARRPLAPRCVVRDSTYGTMEIYGRADQTRR